MGSNRYPDIDGARLWQSIEAMGRIGGLPNGGCNRQALTAVDKEGRDLFARWCEAAGARMRIDRFGNQFALRPGTMPELPLVATGSHLDTQPKGGRFDGVYGVLAGLEVLRALADAQVETRRTIAVVNWTNEEGCRIIAGCTGSGGFAGSISSLEALGTRSIDGTTVAEDLERIGYAGPLGPRAFDISAYVEAHIEQGPILEQEGVAIGIVTAVQGARWFRVVVDGTDRHAGTTPFELRQDSLVAAAEAIVAFDALGRKHGPDLRITVGRIEAAPGSINTTPSRTTFTIDLRHPASAMLDAMAGEIERIMQAATARTGTTHAIERLMEIAPVTFDARVADCLRDAAKGLGIEHRDMLSGAFHDACYIAPVAPTAMLFIPCRDGISHAEEEYASPAHCAAGAQVLLSALVELANA